jgi:putative ABC transport system permease protein
LAARQKYGGRPERLIQRVPASRMNARRSFAAMIRSETWKVALGALRANKLRAFLTMLGVVIGSACIVLVVSVALTGKRYIIAQIEGVGSNLVYAELVRSGSHETTTLADEISLADMEAVRQEIPQVVEVAGTHDIAMPVVAGGFEHPVTLVGVTDGFQQIRKLVILRGRYFDTDDMNSSSKACLLTEHLATVIFPDEDPTGRRIRVGEFSFIVIGVFRERVTTFGQSEIQRDSIIVPFPLVKYFVGTEAVGALYAQSDRAEDVPQVTAEVGQVLKSRHRPGAEYHVQNLSSILEVARHISFALTVILLAIASIALAISGIGIMNIMLVTVTERTREIGIRKSVGARHREILYQFLIEAVMISGTGATAGILIAVSVILAIPLLIEPLLEEKLSVPLSWLSVVVAFGVSCLTGVLFGYLPASKAAKLEPTESLRYE